MISIKCKIKNQIEIDDYLRQFNNVVRFAYNRFCEEHTLSEVYHLCNKEMNNISLLDATLVESACLKAEWTFETRGKGIIFGGWKAFWDVKFGKLDKFELNKKKNKWLYSQGRSDRKGNKKFNFDLNKNKVVFKPEREIKIEIEFENVSKNHRRILEKAQFLADLKQCPIGVLLSEDYIVFQIDEKIIQEEKQKYVKNRILSIDSNPQFIGITICDFINDKEKKIIRKEVLDLRGLADASTNKRHHEVFNCAQHIAKLAKHYKCELVAYENLTIKPKDNKKGKSFNKKVNGLWNRTKFFQNLIKWCGIYNIKSQAIAPEYSSFIGQIINPEEPDMIAAALEIGRRAYIFNRVYLVKDLPKENFSGVVFPEFTTDSMLTRWKEIAESQGCKNWKQLFKKVEKSKMSYRFLFYEWIKNPEVKSLRLKSRKTNVFLHFI